MWHRRICKKPALAMKQRNIAIDTEAIELVAKMIAERPEARFTPEQVLADKFM